MPKCDRCKQEKQDIRISTDDGAYGPVDVQTCEDCHNKDYFEAKSEAKKFGYRTKLKPWNKLTTKGAYSTVR